MEYRIRESAGCGAPAASGANALLTLLHLCDSLFPIGTFAHSDGLEAATASGAVTTPEHLSEWLATCLDETIARSDGPAIWLAWAAFTDRAWDAMMDIDREIVALRPSSAARRASRGMGLRLLTTWHALYPDEALAEMVEIAHRGDLGPALPVAFAAACSAGGVSQRMSVEAFAYTRLAASVSAAMRLMACGQTAAHTLLADALRRVPEVVDAVQHGQIRLESFAPAMELAGMTQQYVRSRLFRS